MALRVSLVVLGSLLGCGRIAFQDDDSPRPKITLVAGVSTVDVEICVNGPARVRYVVTAAPWSEGWRARDFETSAGSPDAITTLVVRDCATRTLSVEGEESPIYVYAAADGVDDEAPSLAAASTKLHPTFTKVSFDAKRGPAYYWIHYPESYYRDPTAPLPTLLYLHGESGKGNGGGKNLEYLRDFEELPRLYMHRALAVRENPFLLYVPQCNANQDNCSGWQSADLMDLLDDVLADVKETAPVDEKHFYATGAADGAEGAWRYAIHRPELVAAIVSVGSTYVADAPSLGFYDSSICRMSSVAVWAFHNGMDPLQPVSNSKHLVDLLEGCMPAPATRLDVGEWGQVQGGWVEVYGGTHGFRFEDAPSIYGWLLKHSR